MATGKRLVSTPRPTSCTEITVGENEEEEVKNETKNGWKQGDDESMNIEDKAKSGRWLKDLTDRF